MPRPRKYRTANDSNSEVATTDAQNDKKLRNRLSQKAFRLRQTEYIRELEDHVASLSKSDNELISELKRENKSLRSQLLDVHIKLESVQANLQTISSALSGSLKTSKEEPDEESLHDASAAEAVIQDDDNPILQLSQGPYDNNIASSSAMISSSASSAFHDMIQTSVPWRDLSLDSGDNAREPLDGIVEQVTADACWDISDFAQYGIPSDNHQEVAFSAIPNIWTYQYQMGPAAYQKSFAASQDNSVVLGMDWAPSNSPFSEHLALLKTCLLDKWTSLGTSFMLRPELLSQSVSMVLSMFNSVSRPEAMSWYARTRSYHIVDLTTWQLQPSRDTYEKVHPIYRPTSLQLAASYPCIIDWIPFASIRERLIKLHAANPHLDSIVCDAVSSYVVEARLSELVTGCEATPVYVRVLDLLDVRGEETVKSTHLADIRLPAASINTLFNSRQHARLAFKHLNMDKGLSHYKMDPQFFGRYPELYDFESNVMAKGIPIRPHSKKNLPSPRSLDSATVDVYRNFTDFSLSVLWKTSFRESD